MAQDTAYKQNPLLKQRGVQIDFTKDQVKEIIKCSQDLKYPAKPDLEGGSVDIVEIR